jgi:hypothetical protein
MLLTPIKVFKKTFSNNLMNLLSCASCKILCKPIQKGSENQKKAQASKFIEGIKKKFVCDIKKK